MGTLYTGGSVISSVTIRSYDSDGNAGWTAYHNNNIFGIAVDSSNIVIAGGGRVSFPSGVTTLAYDGLGNLLWTADHGTTIYTTATHGGYYYTVGNRTSNLTTRKYDIDGNLIWARDYHGANLRAIAIDSDENFYVAGVVNSSITTRKYDSDGDLIWSVNHGLQVNAIAIDSNGNVYTGGVGDSGSSNYTTRKYDNDGNLTWSLKHDPSGPSTVNCIAVDSSGNVYTAGTRVSGSPNITTRKYDTDGNETWNADHGNEVKCIVVDELGNVYTGGLEIGSPEYTTRKYNSSGTLQWSVNHNSTVWCIAYNAPAVPPALPISISLGVPLGTFAALPPAVQLSIALATPSGTQPPAPPDLLAYSKPPQTFYRLYITDSSGVTEIPMGSFQCKRRRNDSAWLDIEIPQFTQSLVDFIADRVGRELVIYSGVRIGTTETLGQFLRATLTEYRYERDIAYGLIRLTGRVIPTAYETGNRNLIGVQRRGKNESKLTARASVDFLLRPGDTVDDGINSWVVDSITYFVGPMESWMDLKED